MSCWKTWDPVLCNDSYLRSAINCKDHLMMIMMIMMMTNLTSNMCPLYHHHGSWSLIFSPVVHSVFSIVLRTLFYHLTSPRLVSYGSVRSSLQVISQREISTLELCFSCSTIFLLKTRTQETLIINAYFHINTFFSWITRKYSIIISGMSLLLGNHFMTVLETYETLIKTVSPECFDQFFFTLTSAELRYGWSRARPRIISSWLQLSSDICCWHWSWFHTFSRPLSNLSTGVVELIW